MRQTRRGCFAAQGGGAKYVWAVYNLAYGIDESAGGTAGNFSVSSNNYRRAAKSYTVSGTYVNLVDSVQTTAANLAPGDYIVTVANTNSTATTGTTLYKVTGVSGSYFSYTISYTAYTPALIAKGEDTGERVESTDGTAYPHYGVQDGYFYVLIRGLTTVSVWDVYSVKTTYGYKEQTRTGSNYLSEKLYTNSYLYRASSYTFNAKNGRYTLTSPTQLSTATTSALSGLYWVASSSTPENIPDIYYGCTLVDWPGYGSTGTITGQKNLYSAQDTSLVYESKGTATGESVQSVNPNEYPQDGKQDDYWYVYTGTQEVYIDNT